MRTKAMSNWTEGWPILVRPTLGIWHARETSSWPSMLPLLGLVFLLGTLARFVARYYRKQSIVSYPVINTSAAEYREHAKSLLTKALEKYDGQPFKVDTGVVQFIILDPKYASELRANPYLDSTTLLQKAYKHKIAGFEPFMSLGSDLLLSLIKHGLSRNIDDLGEVLARETAQACHDILGSQEEWNELTLAEALKDVLTRVSLSVFVGPELCRNPEWHRVSKLYYTQAHKALRYLRLYPDFMRPLVGRFCQDCRQLRTVLSQARKLTDDVLRERQMATTRCPGKQYKDALNWSLELAQTKGIRPDPAVWQLALSAVSLHTTSDLLGQAVLDLCKYSELAQPLRDELQSVMADNHEKGAGACIWSRAGLQNLKLMDSFLKESQRLKPVSIISMGRWTMTDIILKDGTILPKNNAVAISCHWMWDPERYENPHNFDGFRFYKRQREGDRSASLVSTSAEHLGFGHGHRACPGRYFADFVAKIVFSHILMSYDVKLVDDAIQPVMYGFETNVNPKAKIHIRARGQKPQF